MILKNHIAYRLLTEFKLKDEIIKEMYPEQHAAYTQFLSNIDPKAQYNVDGSDWPENVRLAGTLLMHMVGVYDPKKNYYVTQSVMDKMDFLKVKRNDIGQFDWTVFKDIPSSSKLFIFPNNSALRVNVVKELIHFFFIRKNKGSEHEIGWTRFYVNRLTGLETFNTQTTSLETAVTLDLAFYRLFCFFYLTEMDEVIVNAGRKHGTRKEGKVVNSLDVPVTILDTRWNTTVIRTEGFDVSGHFRLQPCGPEMSQHKIIFIQPFKKHGYIRKAKSEDHEG